MDIGIRHARKFLRLSGAALILSVLPLDASSAQQYLGNVRQRCQGAVTVTTEGGSLQVRQFEARSAEVNSANVKWQCPDQPQPAEVQCPPNTNRVLVDRSQGGSVFSIVCLQK
jgi:hypothetical protein